MPVPASAPKPKIAFVHPDLGIGGAERLVVDAAVGLQSRGHSIQVFTSHHDPSHCFEESRDGTLNVSVLGDWLPRDIAGKGHILFAILRGVVLALSLLISAQRFDVIIVDQLSASIPLLRFTNAKILFYCHFPDKLLTQRESLLKKLYRMPVDLLEEVTTRAADDIVVNSKFTAQIFERSFPSIKKLPEVLYPGIHVESYAQILDLTDPSVAFLVSSRQTIVSINRFERKKNLRLAIDAFSLLLKKNPSSAGRTRLVVAGGYDPRVVENKEHLQELDAIAKGLGLHTHIALNNNSSSAESATTVPPNTQVLFLPSFNIAQRTFLLMTAALLVYTPSNEHFGIVPVEAMYASLPVVAVNTGGPTETVVDAQTGYLRDAQPEQFAEAMAAVLADASKAKEQLGRAGKKRVEELFTSVAFIDKLEAIVERTLRSRNADAYEAWWRLCATVGGTAAAILLAVLALMLRA
ncbi:Alpha-1,3-mannosyltransferase-like protein [Geranomyces variabilis]|uniref:Alpha-1,3/1,6-mannosyltransferase ALG2 n=1 Tax=Geranomyces variabilis TaxID=109894 RepID=A0AAD5TEN4_9FUNG|nr:Alpha-1,3-mannosyltransferase-like protein [Geranomyces variabilis]